MSDVSLIKLRISLAIVFNNSSSKGLFPDNPKTACVSPLDKHTFDNYPVNNFQPVYILKIYEKIVRELLLSKMEHHFLPFISAYRKVLLY